MVSAYASRRWLGEAINELKAILISDPTDVLARHDLLLCYRDKGWLKESLEEMKKANEYAATDGNIAGTCLDANAIPISPISNFSA